jgi:hypothetical protein
MEASDSMAAEPYKRLKVNGRLVREHVAIAENILGRRLPRGVQVHHVNEIKKDNRHENLVICPNLAYHHLLHQRTRAFDACGHADWLVCAYCGKHDDPKNLLTYTRGSARHAECQSAYGKSQYKDPNSKRSYKKVHAQ